MATPKVKIPRTIEQARAIVVDVLGRQREISLWANWFFSSRDGRTTESVEFNLRVYAAEDHACILDVRAGTPADLVRETIRAFEAWVRTREGPRLMKPALPDATDVPRSPSLFG